MCQVIEHLVFCRNYLFDRTSQVINVNCVRINPFSDQKRLGLLYITWNSELVNNYHYRVVILD
jgi:hypothetical protein